MTVGGVRFVTRPSSSVIFSCFGTLGSEVIDNVHTVLPLKHRLLCSMGTIPAEYSPMQKFFVSLSCFMLLILPLTGCMFIKLDRELTELGNLYGLAGTITGRPEDQDQIFAVIYKKTDAGLELYRAVIVNVENRRYSVEVTPGTYYIAAFADLNNNLEHDKGEPAGYYGYPSPVEIKENARYTKQTKVKDHLDFSISADKSLPPGYDGEIALTSDLVKHAVIKTGELIHFDDPLMAEKYGRLGYWEPVSFLREVGLGIFFLEKYDPHKTPVLLIHGAVGTPLGWKETVEAMDRRRYQPWFYYYPSGLHLDDISRALNLLVEELHDRYRFRELVVIAHSMGGLVARSFILKNTYESGGDYIRRFISVSTPWNGHKMTEKGVSMAPAAVPSWHDMVPESPFIRSLHENTFPSQLKHYLLFSYKGDCSLFLENNDGTVELSSQLDYRAQAEAERIFAFNSGHAGIIHSQEYLMKIRKLLNN